MLTKVLATEEGVKLVGCLDSSWNQRVVFCQEGQEKKTSICNWGSVFCLGSFVFSSPYLVIVDCTICEERTGYMKMEGFSVFGVQGFQGAVVDAV